MGRLDAIRKRPRRDPAGGSGAPEEVFKSIALLSAARRDPKRSWRLTLIASVLLHALFPVGLLILPWRITKQPDERERINIVFYQPEAHREAVVPLERPEPEPMQIVEAEPPRAEPPVAVEPPVVRNEPLPEPRVEPPARPVVDRPGPPEPAVQTEVLREREPEPVAKAPRREVRAVGFAEPQVAAPERARAERSVAPVGGFAVTLDEAPTPKRQHRVVADGSFGKGAVSVPREAEQPVRGTVTDTAFGELARKESAPRAAKARTVEDTSFHTVAEENTPPAKGGGGSVVDTAFDNVAVDAAPKLTQPGSVQSAGFVIGAVAAKKPRQHTKPLASLDAPVEIVSKPKPLYTDEARDLRIEGEVVLEVTFDASGRLRVLRVVGGLGHGLDEAAVDAAKKIRFTPARRNGRPVDYTATLRVVFRLA